MLGSVKICCVEKILFNRHYTLQINLDYVIVEHLFQLDVVYGDAYYSTYLRSEVLGFRYVNVTHVHISLPFCSVGNRECAGQRSVLRKQLNPTIAMMTLL